RRGGATDRPRIGSEQTGQLRRRQRPRVVVALAAIADEVPQPAELIGRLDALGGDVDAHPVGQPDDGLDDRQVRVVARQPGYERAVDLDRVEGQRLQVGEGRVPRAEVV